MMRKIQVHPPDISPPPLPPIAEWVPSAGPVWQVLGGDRDHWRAGIYSPSACRAEEITELERHDCPELFLLLSGRLTLAVWTGQAVAQADLNPGVPVVVCGPHAGFCPDGPRTGTAFVVERDSFDTEYRPLAEWGRDVRE